MVNNFYEEDSTPVEAKYVIDTTPNPFAFDSSDSSASSNSEDEMKAAGEEDGGAEAAESRENDASNDTGSGDSEDSEEPSEKTSDEDEDNEEEEEGEEEGEEEEEDSDDEMPLPLFLLERHDEIDMLGNGVNYLNATSKNQRQLEHKSKKSR